MKAETSFECGPTSLWRLQVHSSTKSSQRLEESPLLGRFLIHRGDAVSGSNCFFSRASGAHSGIVPALISFVVDDALPTAPQCFREGGRANGVTAGAEYDLCGKTFSAAFGRRIATRANTPEGPCFIAQLFPSVGDRLRHALIAGALLAMDGHPLRKTAEQIHEFVTILPDVLEQDVKAIERIGQRTNLFGDVPNVGRDFLASPASIGIGRLGFHSTGGNGANPSWARASWHCWSPASNATQVFGRVG